ncbi:MAG: hypothetical protein QGD90_04405, partial [Candidatus Hydrogenedentes bacterium]|nr:hypothetical protein [Candidatus Hydrogenedentota bacterium]
ELLDILVCPENKTAVKLVDDDALAKINEAIQAKTLKNRAGETIEESIDGGLLREDGVYLYPIRDDIPIMLIDESIPMAQLD